MREQGQVPLHLYQIAAKRYSRAKGLFDGSKTTALPERTLRAIVKKIQGINFHAASNETMQQVFMSFVPAVFKKALDQYFTPIELVKCMVDMVSIGPNDKIVDPGMGTADFLTAAVQYRTEKGDDDIVQRIYGMDSDDKAYDLAIVNMILNKDGSSNLSCEDSILKHNNLAGEMGVALCNPPFGEKSVESRQAVLQHYELGHEWHYGDDGRWHKTDAVQSKQQLGLLFIERCYKLLDNGGRLGIILPEGYLSTAMYGYVRQWLTDRFRIIGLIELPRRIFLKSNADLRSNVVIAQKLPRSQLKKAIEADYPIYSNMVRKVGFKMGKGFSPLYVKDRDTGIEIRGMDNERITDSDFRVIVEEFEQFTKHTRWAENTGNLKVPTSWKGARISDVLEHPSLDLKPRRLMPAALQNITKIKSSDYVRLSEIADVVSAKIDILREGPSHLWRPVAGLDIHAVEGFVTPSHPRRAWQIAEEKKQQVFKLKNGDIVIGLVRPERRNIGLLIDGGTDIIGIPDGISVVRIRKNCAMDYPQGWLFSVLRSEACRLQFWTESGGTSYGKLSDEQISNALIPVPTEKIRLAVGRQVTAWASALVKSNEAWTSLGTDHDRRPILNSSGFGLMPTTDWDDVEDE
ncbi:N-6 DNA methylase [Mesorhizobium caraganae]|uniref:N-6 DNA methylase n=1 Tax=Mesorhizobium caraganae TaxID=483206 RepID=A0ABV1Z5Z5_9HYPH